MVVQAGPAPDRKTDTTGSGVVGKDLADGLALRGCTSVRNDASLDPDMTHIRR